MRRLRKKSNYRRGQLGTDDDAEDPGTSDEDKERYVPDAISSTGASGADTEQEILLRKLKAFDKGEEVDLDGDSNSDGNDKESNKDKDDNEDKEDNDEKNGNKKRKRNVDDDDDDDDRKGRKGRRKRGKDSD